MPPRNHTEIHLLQRIASRAREFASLRPKAALSLSSKEDAPRRPRNVDFPPPQSMSTELVSLGLHSAVSEKVSAIFCFAVTRLKGHLEQTSRHALHASARTDTRPEAERLDAKFCAVMVSLYAETMRGWRSQIVDAVAARIRDIRVAQLQQACQGTSRSFNQAAVPILEQFFVKSNRPSRREKQQLARQTEMDYKQINVWFQNRRSRSKRHTPDPTHTEASKSSISFPPDLAASLARILDQYVVDTCQRPGIDEETVRLKKHIQSSLPFSISRPLHAYPMSYPPLCAYEPFPILAETRQFPTQWSRSPSSTSTRHHAVDISELSDLLGVLRLDDQSLGSIPQSDHPSEVPLACAAICPGSASLPRAIGRGVQRIVKCVSGMRDPIPPIASSRRGWTFKKSVLRSKTIVPEAHLAEKAFQTKTESTSTSRLRLCSAKCRKHIRDPLSCHTAVGDEFSLALNSTAPLSTVHGSKTSRSQLALPGQPYTKERSLRQKRSASPLRVPAVTKTYPLPCDSTRPSTLQIFTPSIPLTPLFRMSSFSSLRSVSTASTTSTDSELLKTPASTCGDLPDLDSSTVGLYTDLGDLKEEDMNTSCLLDPGYLNYSMLSPERMGVYSMAPLIFAGA